MKKGVFQGDLGESQAVEACVDAEIGVSILIQRVLGETTGFKITEIK